MSRPRSTRVPGEGGRSRTPAHTQNSTHDASMATWSEPPLKALAPSFKEYPHLNIERHGVLQEMAPLGTMPSSKLKKAARQGTPRPVVTIVQDDTLKPTVEVTEVMRELMTPDPAMEERKTPEPDNIEEQEYNPQTPQAQTSPIRRKSFSQSSHRGQSSQGQLSPSMSMSASPSKAVDSSVQRIDKVVNAAICQALQQGRYPTAYALRSLYDEFTGVTRIQNLFELVFYNAATEEQLSEFKRLMTFRKKEGKKDDKAIKFFKDCQGSSTPATMSHSRSFSITSPSKGPSSASVVNGYTPTSPFKELEHITKKQKSGEYRSPFPPVPTSIGGIPFPAFTPPVAKEAEPAKNKRSNGAMNGNVNGSSRATRSGSMSSISSLSSLDEEILGQDLLSPQSHKSTSKSPHRKHRRQHLVGDREGEDSNTMIIGQTSRHPSQMHQHPSHAKSKANNTTGAKATPALNSNADQPITHNQLLGPKLHAFPTSNPSTTTKNSTTFDHHHYSTSSSTITNNDINSIDNIQSTNNDSSSPMAAVLGQLGHNFSTANLPFPALLPSQQLSLPSHPQKTVQTKLKFGKKAVEKVPAPTQSENLTEPEATTALKRKAKEITDNKSDIFESFVRDRPSKRQDTRLEAEGDSSASVTATAPLRSGQTLRLRAPQNKKTIGDDAESPFSPTFPLLLPDVGRSATPSSRAGTPNPAARPVRKAKTGGPRMKTS